MYFKSVRQVTRCAESHGFIYVTDIEYRLIFDGISIDLGRVTLQPEWLELYCLNEDRRETVPALSIAERVRVYRSPVRGKSTKDWQFIL